VFELFDLFEPTVLILVLVAVRKPRIYCGLAVKKVAFVTMNVSKLYFFANIPVEHLRG
jgi:hypothetical protein